MREQAVKVMNQSFDEREVKIKSKEKELRAWEINLRNQSQSIDQYIEEEAEKIYLQRENVLDQREAEIDRRVENCVSKRLEKGKEEIDREREEKRAEAQNEANEIIAKAEESKRKADWLWGKCFILVLIALLFLGLNQGCDRIQRVQVKNAKAEVKKVNTEMDSQREKLRDIYICREDYVPVQRIDGSDATLFSYAVARVYKENQDMVYIHTDYGNYKITKDKLFRNFEKIDVSSVL